MRKNSAQKNDENTWGNWLKNNFLIAEAIPLYIIGGTGVWLHKKSGGVSLPEAKKLRQSIQDNSYVWLPAVTSLVISSLNNYFGRRRENRDVRRMRKVRREEQLYRQMLDLMTQGESAFDNQKYTLALEQFTECRKLYNELFIAQESTREKQIFLSCVYKQGLSAFMLRKYKMVLDLVTSVIQDESYIDNTHNRISLLNLRGLTYFQLGNFNFDQEQQKRHWSFAKADFLDSYKINRMQNSVYLFIKFLMGDYKFITENIPSEFLNPLIDLSSYNSKLMEGNIVDICAIACMRTHKWQRAIFLLEDRISSISPGPDLFFDLGNLNYRCAEAYEGLIDVVKKNGLEHTFLYSIGHQQRLAPGQQVEHQDVLFKKNCNLEALMQMKEEKMDIARNYIRAIIVEEEEEKEGNEDLSQTMRQQYEELSRRLRPLTGKLGPLLDQVLFSNLKAENNDKAEEQKQTIENTIMSYLYL